jgi:hypothetical protein
MIKRIRKKVYLACFDLLAGYPEEPGLPAYLPAGSKAQGHVQIFSDGL